MESEQIGPAVEADWKRVDNLLGQRDEAAAALAVVEANKIFCWVLDLVSYGATTDAMIHNAEWMLDDLRGVLEARRVYKQIVDEPGAVIGVKQAKHACDAYMAAILDMVGDDEDEPGWAMQILNALNFFWGHHPKFLISILIVLIALVGGVVFLADTGIGHWLVSGMVGFSRFVLASPPLVVGLLAALVVAWLASWLLSGKHSRR